MFIKARSEIGTSFAKRSYDPQEDQAHQRQLYEGVRDQTIRLVDHIEDEFYRGFALHQMINMCMVAREPAVAKALLLGVRDQFLREKIYESSPALKGALGV